MKLSLNKFVNLIFVLFLAIPLPVIANHVPTQPPYGQELSIADGNLQVAIKTSDGFEDSPPEKYTIFFNKNDSTIDTSDYCVSTSFGHTANNEWNNHFITLTQLRYYFNTINGDTIYVRIRSDNDTDNSYSTLTQTISITYPDLSPYDEVTENWSAPTGTDACNDTSTTTTTTTSSTTTSSTTTTLPPETTTTTSTTTTSTTTTTLPPPPPPTTTTTTLYVVVNEDGTESKYTKSEVEDGTVDRDNERKENENIWDCYMTNAQLERGDCPAYNDSLKEKEEEVIIVNDEKSDTEKELPNDDVVVLEVEPDDETKVDVPIEKDDADKDKDLEIEVVELSEETQLDDDIIVVEDEVDELLESEDIKDEPIVVVEVEGDVEEVLVEPIQKDVEEKPTPESKIDEVIELEIKEDLSDEQVAEKIEEYVEELDTEEVIEVLTEVNDVGVQNLEQVSVEVQKVVQAVVEEAIENVEELTEKQVEVVANVLQVETEDVAIVAEQVKSNVAVAQAVEEYVERAVDNADVEDYTLADVTTEIQFESFVADPISVIVDIDFDNISLNNIADDMTQDQRDKAQEVIVPTVLVRIVSMFRRLSW